jgi:hypothetical protein
MVAAISVLGVGIGAPLVQNGSAAGAIVSCAVEIGRILTISNRDRTPISGAKGM